MTRQELVDSLSLTLKKTKVQELTALAGQEKLPVRELLKICFSKEKPAIAFRAAWVLEHVVAMCPVRFMPFLPEFLRRLPEQQNKSCQRHFTKILLFFTNPKSKSPYQNQLKAVEDREQVVEVVFEWLINPHTPVAVRVNCLEILLYLRNEFSWVREELEAQTAFYLNGGSAAMKSRGSKILNQLWKQSSEGKSTAPEQL